METNAARHNDEESPERASIRTDIEMATGEGMNAAARYEDGAQGEGSTLEFLEPSENCIFASMRYRNGHVLKEATLLKRELQQQGFKLYIIDMRSGEDIDKNVFSTIEHCDTFLVFGTHDYGEDTGNSASTYEEYKYAKNKGKRIIPLCMIPSDQEFTNLQARVIFGTNRLFTKWIEGQPMPTSVVDEVLDAVKSSRYFQKNLNDSSHNTIVQEEAKQEFQEERVVAILNDYEEQMNLVLDMENEDSKEPRPTAPPLVEPGDKKDEEETVLFDYRFSTEFGEPSDKCIFASMRYRNGRVLKEATLLQRELQQQGFKLYIIGMRSGEDIDAKVFSAIEHCDTFLVFGTHDYGEDTGNSASTYEEYRYAKNKGKRIIPLCMIPSDQEFTNLQARVIFGTGRQFTKWIEGHSMPTSVVDEVLDAVQSSQYFHKSLNGSARSQGGSTVAMLNDHEGEIVVLDSGSSTEASQCFQTKRRRRLLLYCLSALLLLLVAVVVGIFWPTTPPTTPRFKLLPQDGRKMDEFGSSVAISGDTVVVGARCDDNRDNGSNSGSAYIFNASDGTQLGKLLPNDGSADDKFGISVAVSGDTVVVGATDWDESSTAMPGSGSAYVFSASNTEPLTLSPVNGTDDDYFGISVAVSGDTVVVGACGDDGGSGSAYIFNASDGTQLDKLLPNDGSEKDQFGFSVAISGDTVVVGAYCDDNDDDDNSSDSGSAYIFSVSNSHEPYKLKPKDVSTNDRFGISVAVDADTVVVGSEAGSAYIFSANGTQLHKLSPNDDSAGDKFGISVAVSGDTVVIGPSGGDESGSAYTFSASTGAPLDKLRPQDGRKNDLFGSSVAISNDTVVVGAYGAYNVVDNDVEKGNQSGSAYVF